MSTLADELLADLGGDDEAEVKQKEEDADAGLTHSNGVKREQHDDDSGLTRSAPSARANGKRKARFMDEDDDGDAAAGTGAGASSLADELEDDAELDGDDDEDEEEEMGDDEDAGKQPTNLPSTAVAPAAEMEQSQVDALDLGPDAVRSVHTIATLARSAKLRDALDKIEHYASLDTPDIEGVLEESPEYQLIVSANNLAVNVDNEIMLVHKFIRDHYSPRFPELESLIRDPWDFVRAVRALGNSENLSKAHLEGILPNSIIVVISMTASTTSGQKVSEQAWKSIQEACDLVFELDAARVKILKYVESRMTFIAPNLSAVVGTRVATKLMGAAGGLHALTKIPSCNLEVLGAQRKAAPGMAQRFSNRHVGFVAQSDLVQGVGEDYRRQAQRKVAAKAVIAARVDALAVGSVTAMGRDGSYGRKLHADLDKALEKLQEPPPSKMTKALPVPKEGGKKQRRGGRRARKLKQMYGMTELRKMANRVEFGKAEEEATAFDDSIGLGMINSTASGKIRAQTAETRTKVKMSKRNKDRVEMLKRASASNRSGQESGTQTSLAFTPFQGIELVDPSRTAKKVEDANAKWFREGQFSILPGAAGSSSSALTIPGSSSKSAMGPPPVPKKEK
ncbi:U4/U6-U5 snRNP complex subunit prp31 [Tilletia horrida]|nr:U4/U6-U5 snRNP complex subunit prp31 [Tilletia horrida]